MKNYVDFLKIHLKQGFLIFGLFILAMNYCNKCNYDIPTPSYGRVCYNTTDRIIGIELNIDFQGNEFNNYLSVASHPYLRITLSTTDPTTAGYPMTSTVDPKSVTICVPITINTDNTVTLPQNVNTTHFLRNIAGTSTEEVIWVTRAIYDMDDYDPDLNNLGSAIAPITTLVSNTDGIHPLGKVSICNYKPFLFTYAAERSIVNFEVDTTQPDATWVVRQFKLDYSSDMMVVWPPPPGDPILGDAIVDSPIPPHNPLGNKTFNIVVLASGYVVSQVLYGGLFWQDVKNLTSNLIRNYVFGRSSVRNNVRIIAIPCISYSDYSMNPISQSHYRIFNDIQDPSNQRVDINRINKDRAFQVLRASGLSNVELVFMINDTLQDGSVSRGEGDFCAVSSLGIKNRTGGSFVHEIGHSIWNLPDEYTGGSHWDAVNNNKCFSIDNYGNLWNLFTTGEWPDFHNPFYVEEEDEYWYKTKSNKEIWASWGLRLENCPVGHQGNNLVDQDCYIYVNQTGLGNGSGWMRPEQVCTMSENRGPVEYCRVCTTAIIRNISVRIENPVVIVDIQNEILQTGMFTDLSGTTRNIGIPTHDALGNFLPPPIAPVYICP